MDVPASMDGGPFGAPPVVGQSLSPTRVAELSEDGEIFDSDDDDGDLPTLRQILGSPKQVIEVIDLTCDGDGGSEGDDGGKEWQPERGLAVVKQATTQYLRRFFGQAAKSRSQVFMQKSEAYRSIISAQVSCK